MTVRLMTQEIFSPSELALVKGSNVPHHIAFIPDGNRRWAQKQNEQPIVGHRTGGNVLIEIVKAAKELGVKVLTFYAFSTENWTRSAEEVNAFMWMIQDFFREECDHMISNGIRLNAIGNTSALPEDVQNELKRTIDLTSHCVDVDVVLALNYGARDEMRRAIHRMVDDCAQNKLQKEQITEALISQYLDTAPWGDPELLIRTSGELRLSNYLLWQSSYAEFYSTPVLWPDFTSKDLLNSVIEFQHRTRRMGE